MGIRSNRKIQKKIKRLQEELRKVELRPCSGDLELRQRENEFLTLKREIDELVREVNQFEFFIKGREE